MPISTTSLHHCRRAYGSGSTARPLSCRILLTLLIFHAAAAHKPPSVPWFSLRAREAALEEASVALPAGLADDLHTLVDLARQCCSDCFDHHVLKRCDKPRLQHSSTHVCAQDQSEASRPHGHAAPQGAAVENAPHRRFHVVVAGCASCCSTSTCKHTCMAVLAITLVRRIGV